MGFVKNSSANNSLGFLELYYPLVPSLHLVTLVAFGDFRTSLFVFHLLLELFFLGGRTTLWHWHWPVNVAVLL